MTAIPTRRLGLLAAAAPLLLPLAPIDVAVATPSHRQSGVLSAPDSAPVGPVEVTARFQPVVAGRVVRVEARTGSGGWATLARGTENKRGVARITAQATGAGRYTFRAVAARMKGHPAVATPTRTITITGGARTGGTTTHVLPGQTPPTFVSSADGRYVAYPSGSGLVSLDRQNGQATTIAASGTPESISADGEVVSFTSSDETLVPGSPACVSRTGVDCTKVYLWHRSTGATTRVTDGGRGLSNSSRLSADGSRLVFYSEAHGLVPGDTTTSGQIYLADVSTGKLTQVTHGDSASVRPDISADGRYVVLSSRATDLVPAATSSEAAAYVYDAVSGRTSRVSPAGVDVFDTEISGDGSIVAYTTDDKSIFVLDRRSGSASRLNASATFVNGLAMSQDGRWVVTEVTDDVRDADNYYPPARLVAYDTTRGGAATTVTTVLSRQGAIYPLEWVGSQLLPFTADESDAGPAGSYLWRPPAAR